MAAELNAPRSTSSRLFPRRTEVAVRISRELRIRRLQSTSASEGHKASLPAGAAGQSANSACQLSLPDSAASKPALARPASEPNAPSANQASHADQASYASQASQSSQVIGFCNASFGLRTPTPPAFARHWCASVLRTLGVRVQIQGSSPVRCSHHVCHEAEHSRRFGPLFMDSLIQEPSLREMAIMVHVRTRATSAAAARWLSQALQVGGMGQPGSRTAGLQPGGGLSHTARAVRWSARSHRCVES